MTHSSAIAAATFIGVLLLAGHAAKARTPIGELDAFGGLTIVGEVDRVFGNRFVLRDETGGVLVDTGPAWFQRISVQKGERLRIVGEMSDGEFEAFAITRDDGEVLRIRPADGPPPWAGARRY